MVTGRGCRSCTGAVPGLHRGCTGELARLSFACVRACPFPIPAVVLLLLVCWCSGCVCGCPRVQLWLSWCSFGGCPSNVCAVATMLLLPLSFCYCGFPFPRSALPKQCSDRASPPNTAPYGEFVSGTKFPTLDQSYMNLLRGFQASNT